VNTRRQGSDAGQGRSRLCVAEMPGPRFELGRRAHETVKDTTCSGSGMPQPPGIGEQLTLPYRSHTMELIHGSISAIQ